MEAIGRGYFETDGASLEAGSWGLGARGGSNENLA